MAVLYKSPCYCTNLRRSAGAVTSYYNKALLQIGLTASQYYLLINLSRMEIANITRWAAHVGLERSTMVRNVHILLERGWIEEYPHGRGKHFKLSEKGWELLKDAVNIWEQLQAELRVFLGEDDSEALLRIARRLEELGGN